MTEPIAVKCVACPHVQDPEDVYVILPPTGSPEYAESGRIFAICGTCWGLFGRPCA